MTKRDKFKLESGRPNPYKVPEGYFESFRVSVLESLPEYPEKPKPVNLSAWQRIKPYIWLAAMFAGIWCMMKVFYTMSGGDRISMDNPPEQVTLALNNNKVYDYYATSYGNVSDIELEEEVCNMYDDMATFERDFKVISENEDELLD